jgi:hypothetical protein
MPGGGTSDLCPQGDLLGGWSQIDLEKLRTKLIDADRRLNANSADPDG